MSVALCFGIRPVYAYTPKEGTSGLDQWNQLRQCMVEAIMVRSMNIIVVIDLPVIDLEHRSWEGIDARIHLILVIQT